MVKQNVIKHCLRLNMQNEQHQRIQKVLEGLNKDIHKSENQFIIKAIDFYIRSFEEDDIVEKQHRNRKPEYVTVEAVEDIRKELESSMKDELIRLLGTAITGGSQSGQLTAVISAYRRNRKKTIRMQRRRQTDGDKENMRQWQAVF